MSAQSVPSPDVGDQETRKQRLSRHMTTIQYGTMNEEQDKMMRSNGIVGSYDQSHLATWRVFGEFSGTVLSRVDLWKEAAILALVFWVVFGGIWMKRPDGFTQIIGSESGIRAFLQMFAMLICFLLSFYTALTLGRWWHMRMAVDQIQDGCKELTMLVVQVTQDEILLDSIQRYARASLCLLFAASQYETGGSTPLEKATEAGLLTKEEADKLIEICPHQTFVQAETLWVWLANAVTRLQQQGLTNGAPHYCALMKAVGNGRGGISTVKAYLDTQIPLGYVHLLCFIVKLHNILLGIMCALLAAKNSGGANGFQPVSVFRAGFKAFFMPFLFNALLILNSDCTDPFGGDPGDFDWNIFDVNLRVSAEVAAATADDLPEWITKTKFKPMQV